MHVYIKWLSPLTPIKTTWTCKLLFFFSLSISVTKQFFSLSEFELSKTLPRQIIRNFWHKRVRSMNSLKYRIILNSFIEFFCVRFVPYSFQRPRIRAIVLSVIYFTFIRSLRCTRNSFLLCQAISFPSKLLW